MDYFNIDSVFELIEKNKNKLRNELDTITFDNDKLSKESDKLLQILEYSPRTRHLERDILKSLPIIKLKPPNEQKISKNEKKTKHSKLPSTPNIDFDSFAISNKNDNQENNEIVKDILILIVENVVEKCENKEKKEENQEEEKNKDKNKWKKEKKKWKKQIMMTMMIWELNAINLLNLRILLK